MAAEVKKEGPARISRQSLHPLPLRKVITPVPVEGGVAGGALPWAQEPNGSACQRRTMAGVQDEAKHAISAMSPLKSWLVEKPQPQR